jgi:hypothetical protein
VQLSKSWVRLPSNSQPCALFIKVYKAGYSSQKTKFFVALEGCKGQIVPATKTDLFVFVHNISKNKGY